MIDYINGKKVVITNCIVNYEEFSANIRVNRLYKRGFLPHVYRRKIGEFLRYLDLLEQKCNVCVNIVEHDGHKDYILSLFSDSPSIIRWIAQTTLSYTLANCTIEYDSFLCEFYVVLPLNKDYLLF